MREADRVDIYTEHIVKEVAREGLTEEVKLEAFTRGKEKEKGYSMQSQVQEKTEYGPFGDWQMWGMVRRESHFSNTFITHNFPFAKCTESREAFDIFGPVLIKGTNTMIRRG